MHELEVIENRSLNVRGIGRPQMTTESSREFETPGLFIRLRYWVAKFNYHVTSALLLREGTWQESLFTSLAPKAGDRILDFGPGSSSTALSLAQRYPEAVFVGADPSLRAIKRAQRIIFREQLGNVSVVSVPAPVKLPFNANSFDKAVCIFGLHDLPPEQKLRVIREIVKVVRHNGSLHIVDFDKPGNRRERRILELATRISGSTAVEPHINGTWPEFLTKCGLAGVRRQSSHSVGIGRIAAIRARKR